MVRPLHAPERPLRPSGDFGQNAAADGRRGEPACGAEYEAWVLRTVRLVARALGAPPAQVHPISAGVLDALLTASEEAGDLEPDAADDLAQANSIFVWEPGGGRPPVDAVVEVSVTAKSGDVDRAGARAHVLAKTGVASRAVALSDAVD